MSYKPTEELILKAAKQNLDRDIRIGLMGEAFEDLKPVTSWDNLPEDEKKIYLEEAKVLLEDTGENYLPDYPDHELIKVEG